MTTIEELKTRWSSLDVASHSRVDIHHPLDLYIGRDASGSKELLLLTSHEIPKVQPSRSISIEIGKRIDGRWAVRFRLIQSSQEEVFQYLCWDLIESTRNRLIPKQGQDFLLSRLRKWQLLMEHGRNGLLSQAAVKGLIGELLFLKQHLFPTLGPVLAIESWMGPEAADRDFVFGDTWYEIKTTDPSSVAVSISSLEQLDVDLEGELIILFLEKTAPIAHDSVTLQGIVNEMRSLLGNFSSVLDLFEDKLSTAGFIDRKEYEEEHFHFKGLRRFLVAGDFPRVRKKYLPSTITGMSYQLSIAGLRDWEIHLSEGVQHGTC